MADKTVQQQANPADRIPVSFYVLLGVMGTAFLGLLGYMISLYLS
jgi:hypothetical protein